MSCMRQTMLTQSGAPGRVIGWTNFSHLHSIHWFCRLLIFHWICLPSILLILVGVELPFCVVVTLSQNVVLCFLESSWVWDRLFYLHCKGFLETWLAFEVPTSFIPFLFSASIWSMYVFQYLRQILIFRLVYVSVVYVYVIFLSLCCWF